MAVVAGLLFYWNARVKFGYIRLAAYVTLTMLTSASVLDDPR